MTNIVRTKAAKDDKINITYRKLQQNGIDESVCETCVTYHME